VLPLRKTKEELQAIKEHYGVNELWSFSKVNKFVTSPYEYYLKYILHVKEDKRDGIYTTSGGTIHDILEKFYRKEIAYEDMISNYEGALFLFDQAELKYNKTDEEKNAKIANKYEDCIKHFFKNHKPFTQKAMIEQFAITNIGGNIFQGYIDFIFKDDEDDTITILDWKSSTIYTGNKVLKEGKQLLIYAQSLIQCGIPIEKIKICWDFLKYVNVSYIQQNGKPKSRQIERNAIGSSLASVIKTKMNATKKYSKEEIDSYLEFVITTNSLEGLPKDISEQFVIEDCLVYIPLSQEILDNLNEEVINTIKTIDKCKEMWYNNKELGMSEQDLDKIWYDTEEQLKANEYYFLNLCGYSTQLHKPFAEYWNKKIKEKEEQNNFFGGLGLSDDTGYAETDLSWLNNY
jgi:RecB family exonuclease